MDEKYIKDILNKIKNNELDTDKAFEKLKHLPYESMGDVVLDFHRTIRKGFPEVIYGKDKSYAQIEKIVLKMIEKNINNILITRTNNKVYNNLKSYTKDIIFYNSSGTIVINKNITSITKSKILIISAGSSDLPVAEEAFVTAEILGNNVELIQDVGVAGIHRLFGKIDIIKQADVLIVVAGFEGALASVVGGIVSSPVIAVPTSVGYGANFGGLAALLAMLNSCSSGITVVNIDNGFGAAVAASIINKRIGGN